MPTRAAPERDESRRRVVKNNGGGGKGKKRRNEASEAAQGAQKQRAARTEGGRSGSSGASQGAASSSAPIDSSASPTCGGYGAESGAVTDLIFPRTCPPPTPDNAGGLSPRAVPMANSLGNSYARIPPGTPRRALRAVPRVNYSQVKRRGPQKGKDNTGRVESAYMESSSSKGGARMTLGKTIETGEAVLDRITRERYEWRDGAYAKTRPIVYDDGG